MELQAAMAIVEALKRLRHLEPLIAQTPDGAIIAVYLDDDGELCEERVYEGSLQ